MKVTHCWKDGPELLRVTEIEEEKINEVYKEFTSLLPFFKNPELTGSAVNEDGDFKKENNGLFLSEAYTDIGINVSPTHKLFSELAKIGKNMSVTPHSIVNYFKSFDRLSYLFSAYKNGQYYKAHRDSSSLTALLWLSEKNYEGGDLLFPDFNTTITPEKNTLIVFPSHYLHEVTTVKTQSEDYVRFCVSAFFV